MRKGKIKEVLERAEEKGGFLFIDKNRGQELEHLSRITSYNTPSILSLNLTDNIQRFAEIINRQYEQIINGQSGKVA